MGRPNKCGPTVCHSIRPCPSSSRFLFWGGSADQSFLSAVWLRHTRESSAQTVDDKSSVVTFTLYTIIQNRMESISSHRQISEEEAADRRYALYNTQPRGGRGIDGWQELSRRRGLNLTPPPTKDGTGAGRKRRRRKEKKNLLLQNTLRALMCCFGRLSSFIYHCI